MLFKNMQQDAAICSAEADESCTNDTYRQSKPMNDNSGIEGGKTAEHKAIFLNWTAKFHDGCSITHIHAHLASS